jgi:tRNA A37 methylthiotransferase MiaB
VQRVLFEGRGKTGALRGRTERSEIVHAAGSAALIGQLVGVRIAGAYKNSLLGEVEGAPAEGPAPRRLIAERRALPVVG